MKSNNMFRTGLVSVLSCFLLLGTAGCMDASFAIVNVPSHFNDVTIKHDVAYGSQPWQKLDIYVPPHAKDEKLDVIVFFYGGRWTFGSKDQYRFVGSTLAQQNFIVVIADYGKYPDVHFPEFVKDGAKTLAWTYDHIAEYDGRPDRIHVSGHSAGAHTGALLTANAQYLSDEGKQRDQVIHDFVGLAGPYDFTPDEPDLKDMFGPPSNYPLMQVPTFIDGTQPPMLLLYGDKDTDVNILNLKKLEKAISQKGGCEQSIIYPGVDHVGLVAGLSWINPQGAPVLQDMVKFMRSPTSACREAAPKK